MNIKNAVGLAAAALIASMGVASAQTLGTPGDGEMSYTPPAPHSAIGAPATAPGGGELSYTVIPQIQLGASSVSTDGAPLTISGVDFVSHDSASGAGANGGLVTLSFENTADVPATDVTFDLSSAGQNLGDYDVRGTFAPGVEIQHESFGTPSVIAPEQLSVAEIRYADGSTWQNENQPNPTERRQASAPSSS